MIRALPLVSALLLAGCAAPVVTRIETAAPAGLPRAATFMLATIPDDLSPLHQQAIRLVMQSLQQRGWQQAEGGDYVLAVTLADKPATSSLQAGDDNGSARAVIAPAADRSNNQGCAKRDHRLGVVMTERVSGAIAYAGSAAEFHCKAQLGDSVPYLVQAALDGMNGQQGPRLIARDGAR